METGIYDPLDALAISAAANREDPFWHVEVVGRTESTNTLCLERAGRGEEAGLAVFAEEQSAGRGRRGNSWQAPPGSALLFSILLRPSHPPAQWHRLTLAAAIAVCRTIEEISTCGSPRIKWPNDILVDSCKLAGILLESTVTAGAGGCVVIGIGLNVHARSFPPDLRIPATSLALASGHAPSRNEIASLLLSHLRRSIDEAFENWQGMRASFAMRDFLAGQLIETELPDGAIATGTASGIDDSGGLLLNTDAGPQIVLREAARITRLRHPDLD